ncbi:MAG TPA: hypothetical protein VE269_06600 [Gaiellaceae bacterium]|nr:hypothetical protein [Gaiellaceae bacterium]
MTSRLRPIPLARGLAVLTAAVAAGGCGAHGHAEPSTRARPKLPHALALRLADASTGVARKLEAGDACAALAAARVLQQQTIDAINRGGVPAELQEPLRATVTDLAARIRCTPPSPAPPAKEHGHGHEDHGKHKGHGGDEGD